MALLRALFEGRSLEKTFVDNPAQWLVEMFGGQARHSGVTVTPSSAMQCSIVYACVRILAETIASLPLKVYRRLEGGGKEPDPEHALYPLLHDQPNPEQTAMEFRETLEGHLCLRGNAYAEIVRDGRGRVLELWPLHPDRVKVTRPADALVYVVRVPGTTSALAGQPIRRTEEIPLRADQVLHLRGLSSDGVLGLSPIGLAAEAIGLTIATEAYGARFFGNGAQPGGVLEHPGRLSKEAGEHLRAQWMELHSGLSNAHRVAILEEGLKWQAVGLQNDHAQFLQTRQFQLGDIARLFRIPGVMLGLDDKTSTYASAEQFFLAFVVHTIRPWVVRWEQALNMKLLTPGERRTHFAEHLVDGLLRGDLKTRYDAYAIGRTNGWLNADDIRELENQNPLPDGQGKVYLVQGAMVPIDQAGRLVTDPTTPAGRRARLVLQEAAARVLRKEIARIRTQAGKLAADPAAWRLWVAEFYGAHADFVAETLQLEPALAVRYAVAHRDALLADGLEVLATWEDDAGAALARLAMEEENR